MIGQPAEEAESIAADFYTLSRSLLREGQPSIQEKGEIIKALAKELPLAQSHDVHQVLFTIFKLFKQASFADRVSLLPAITSFIAAITKAAHKHDRYPEPSFGSCLIGLDRTSIRFSIAFLRHLTDLESQVDEVKHLPTVASYGISRLQLRASTIRISQQELEENILILLASPTTNLSRLAKFFCFYLENSGGMPPKSQLLELLIERVLACPVIPSAFDLLVSLLVTHLPSAFATIKVPARKLLFTRYPEAAQYFVLRAIGSWCLLDSAIKPMGLFPLDFIVPPSVLGILPLCRYLEELLDQLQPVLPKNTFLRLAEQATVLLPVQLFIVAVLSKEYTARLRQCMPGEAEPLEVTIVRIPNQGLVENPQITSQICKTIRRFHQESGGTKGYDSVGFKVTGRYFGGPINKLATLIRNDLSEKFLLEIPEGEGFVVGVGGGSYLPNSISFKMDTIWVGDEDVRCIDS